MPLHRPFCRLPLLLALVWLPVHACTIFVLTDGGRTLFFNNEDWFNPVTRIWFVPAGEGHLGCAYVGFDNGWAQGGVNSAGLAFDWVSGFDDPYQPDPALVPVRGNPSERMLETCTTVEEAMAFYRRHLEPDFRRSRLLVADRTGASVVIGSRNGQLHMAPMNRSRGFGYGRDEVEKALAQSPAPLLENGAAILRACLQPGEGGTKYSAAYDLRSGDVFIYPDPTRNEPVRLGLAAELAKGGHYYDLPHLRDQLAAAPRALLPNMQRFYLDQFAPLAEPAPAMAERLLRIMRDAAAGTMRQEDYAPGLWQGLAPQQKDIAADLARLGEPQSLALIERRETPEGVDCRYLVECQYARILGRFMIDPQGRVAVLKTEFVEMKRMGSE